MSVNPSATPRPARSTASLIAGVVWATLIVVVALVVIGVSLAAGEFNGRMLEVLVTNWVLIAPLAVVAVLLLALGGAELAIAGVIAWVGVAVGMLAPEFGVIPAALLAIGVALVVGLGAGVISGLTRINPALITLGALALLRGVALVWSDGQAVRIDEMETLASPVWSWGALLLAIGGAAVIGFALSRSRVGQAQDEAAAGGLSRVAWLGGLYAFSGLIAGLIGVALIGRLGVGTPTNGSGYETAVVLIALLGGVGVGRGVNRLTLLALAVALVAAAGYAAGTVGLQVADVPAATIEVAKGVLIPVVALLSTGLHWIGARTGS